MVVNITQGSLIYLAAQMPMVIWSTSQPHPLGTFTNQTVNQELNVDPQLLFSLKSYEVRFYSLPYCDWMVLLHIYKLSLPFLQECV